MLLIPVDDRTCWAVSNYQPGFPISTGPMPVAESQQGSWSLVSDFGAVNPLWLNMSYIWLGTRSLANCAGTGIFVIIKV